MKKFADEEELWSLRGTDGWVMMATGEGVETIPVWPHAEFAKESANGPWQGAEPASIQLNEWIARWLPGIQRDGRLIAVFPSAGDNGAVLSSAEFRNLLEKEIDRIR